MVSSQDGSAKTNAVDIQLKGLAANDTYNAEGGDDIIVDGPGVDVMVGGLGFDWRTYYNPMSTSGAFADLSNVAPANRHKAGMEAAMLLAVLHRHAGIAAFDQDVFVNAVGGVKISEPAADLAVLCAIYSSIRNRPLPRGLVVFGEVGLAGEIRPAPRGQDRLREAAKLGFSRAVIPRGNAPKAGQKTFEGLEIIAVDRLSDALDHAGA